MAARVEEDDAAVVLLCCLLVDPVPLLDAKPDVDGSANEYLGLLPSIDEVWFVLCC